MHESLARCVKLQVAHAPGMPWTFSPPLTSKKTASSRSRHVSTCVTHVSRCMSGSLTRGGRENVPGIPGACATRNFTHLASGPWNDGVLLKHSLHCNGTTQGYVEHNEHFVDQVIISRNDMYHMRDAPIQSNQTHRHIYMQLLTAGHFHHYTQHHS